MTRDEFWAWWRCVESVVGTSVQGAVHCALVAIMSGHMEEALDP